MAVIKDVAKLAGVSISTVSKYFNNPSRLSDVYRDKVEKAVKELNFHPNEIARGLRTKRTNTIALIVPDITNTFYVEVYNSFRISAMAKGYTIQLYTTEENINILYELLGQFSPAKVDGVILCFLDEDEIVTYISEKNISIPIVLLSWDISNQFDAVVLNMHSTIYHATSYLITKGHKKIAYINGTRGSRISKEKLSGYTKAMSDHSLPVPKDYMFNGNYLFSTGYQGAKQFMMCPDPPTGIVTANDILAIGACKYLMSHNYRIPQDVSVTSMDGTQLSRIFDPSITTMAMPIPEMCREALGFLINKLEKPGSKNRQSIYEAHLVEGRSTNEHSPLYLDL